MHVISIKKLREFWADHADAEEALKAWFHEAEVASWGNSAELKDKYRTASIINAERVVFNVCGNKYRLVVRINYASGAVFIRFVDTHRKYDKISAETI
jgi:mRNA interferase HigB